MRPTVSYPLILQAWMLCCALMIGCLIYCVAVVNNAYAQDSGIETVKTIMFGLLVVTLALSYPAWMAHSARLAAIVVQTSAWQRSMQRWSTLFYCPRCDSVYVPSTHQSAPAHAMRRLL